MGFFSPFEDISEQGSDHAENGRIKGGDVQIVEIDFHQNRTNVTLRGAQTACALRTRRIKH